MIVVICLVMTVDILLLLATAKLQSVKLHPVRIAAAVALDVLSVLLSSVPGMLYMKHFLFRVATLLLAGLIAFGVSGYCMG